MRPNTNPDRYHFTSTPFNTYRKHLDSNIADRRGIMALMDTVASSLRVTLKLVLLSFGLICAYHWKNPAAHGRYCLLHCMDRDPYPGGLRQCDNLSSLS
jgi:hypothetical protein